MDAIATLASWFVVALVFFAALGAIVRRLEASDPRYRRYGIPRDRGAGA